MMGCIIYCKGAGLFNSIIQWQRCWAPSMASSSTTRQATCTCFNPLHATCSCVNTQIPCRPCGPGPRGGCGWLPRRLPHRPPHGPAAGEASACTALLSPFLLQLRLQELHDPGAGHASWGRAGGAVVLLGCAAFPCQRRQFACTCPVTGPLQVCGAAQPGLRHLSHDPRWVWLQR